MNLIFQELNHEESEEDKVEEDTTEVESLLTSANASLLKRTQWSKAEADYESACRLRPELVCSAMPNRVIAALAQKKYRRAAEVVLEYLEAVLHGRRKREEVSLINGFRGHRNLIILYLAQ